MRRKQHDFKNQLSAIYSMHLTADSLEDLIRKQREYGGFLQEQCRYDKILTGCNNPVLAGYIYYKCISYEKSGILVEYNIHVDVGTCRMPLYEIIESLGILMGNAFENILESQSEHRVMYLAICESTEHMEIEVCNAAKYMKSAEITNLFQQGYSTKGKNRGIGLPSLKRLAEKYDSDIIVKNYTRSEQNWISFKLNVLK